MVAGVSLRPNRSALAAALAAAAILAGVAAFFTLSGWRDAAPKVEEVSVPVGTFSYRPSGEFLRGTQPVDPALRQVSFSKSLIAMKRQVSEADYDACVRARACRALTKSSPARPDYPVVGVSFEDATAYAVWLSGRSGQAWRLPSDEEWAYMAGSRFTDDAIALGDDVDFTQRWLVRYEREGAAREERQYATKAQGGYGDNEHGLTDLSGNVWEWTTSCFTRQERDAAGITHTPFQNCGVRVAEGRHRSYVSDFIRDARGGGCAVGVPPDNLGIRLVRDGL